MRAINFAKEDLSEKEKRSISILDILRRRGPISRPEISKEMGVNVVTISNYIDDFVKSNIVYEKELDVSEGGRRPALLDLNPRAGYIIGVGLNLINLVGLLVDFKGNIITKAQVARPDPSVKDVTECVLDIIREILRRSKEYAGDIRGIGIGIAGLVNKKTGSIHWPQKMDHYYTYASVDVPFRELIEKEFNLPTLIENDATAACFGEHWLDLQCNFKNMLYMFSGVGCGIMINGEIYSGTSGYAGESSIYNYKENDAFSCKLGNSCFLKRGEVDMGVIGDLKAHLKKDPEASEKFFKSSSGDQGNIDLRAVFMAARAKNRFALESLDLAAQRLGIKAAYLVNLFNPQVLIIGGGMEEAGDEFLNKVNLTIREWAFREVTEDLKVIYSQLRENAVALGAASLVMQKAFAQI